jgi:hypothetical protein
VTEYAGRLAHACRATEQAAEAAGHAEFARQLRLFVAGHGLDQDVHRQVLAKVVAAFLHALAPEPGGDLVEAEALFRRLIAEREFSEDYGPLRKVFAEYDRRGAELELQGEPQLWPELADQWERDRAELTMLRSELKSTRRELRESRRSLAAKTSSAANLQADLDWTRGELDRYGDAYPAVVAERDSARRERDAAMAARDEARAENEALRLNLAGVEGERDAADDFAAEVRELLHVPDQVGWGIQVRTELAELRAHAKDVKRLRARDEAAQAVIRAAEKTVCVIERVLNADASEGTPIWEWPDDAAEEGVREVLAAGDELMSVLDTETVAAIVEGEEADHG